MSSGSWRSYQSHGGQGGVAPPVNVVAMWVPSMSEEALLKMTETYKEMYAQYCAVVNTGGSQVSGANSSSSSVVRAWNREQRKVRLSAKAVRGPVAIRKSSVHSLASVDSMSSVASLGRAPKSADGLCYRTMLRSDVSLGAWPTVEQILSLPAGDVVTNEELMSLQVERVAPGQLHVAFGGKGPSWLHALSVTAQSVPAYPDGSLARRVVGCDVPARLKGYPLLLTDRVGGLGGVRVGVNDVRSALVAMGVLPVDVPVVVDAYFMLGDKLPDGCPSFQSRFSFCLEACQEGFDDANDVVLTPEQVRQVEALWLGGKGRLPSLPVSGVGGSAAFHLDQENRRVRLIRSMDSVMASWVCNSRSVDLSERFVKQSQDAGRGAVVALFQDLARSRSFVNYARLVATQAVVGVGVDAWHAFFREGYDDQLAVAVYVLSKRDEVCPQTPPSYLGLVQDACKLEVYRAYGECMSPRQFCNLPGRLLGFSLRESQLKSVFREGVVSLDVDKGLDLGCFFVHVLAKKFPVVPGTLLGNAVQEFGLGYKCDNSCPRYYVVAMV